MLVSPSVAVRYQPLERLVAELTGEKFHPYLSGTLTSPLGNVPPNRELCWFFFPADADPGPPVREMFGIIKGSAVPWMERHRSLESFIDDLKANFATGDSKRLRLPAAYYLKGECDLARALVMQGLERIGDGSGPVSTQYRRFAQALLARLDAGAPACS